MVKIGIVGIGSIAEDYISLFAQGLIRDAKITALASRNRVRLEDMVAKYDLKETALFETLEEMLEGDLVDAVMITTPHTLHPAMTRKVLARDKHAMVDKPLGIFASEIEALTKEALLKPHLKTAVMFNYRSSDIYGKAKELIDSGELGQLRRVIWQVTNLYRSYGYYENSPWKGSYEKEGGGVLMNQAIHQLDTIIWMVGMPKEVVAFMKEGFHRPISTENDLLLHMFYENGATGQFITSTHESPGTNRLELSLDQGQIVIENDSTMRVTRLSVNEEDFARSGENPFLHVPAKSHELNFPKLPNKVLQERLINNFVQSVLGREEIICPFSEATKSVRVINATYLSAWKGQVVPVDFRDEEYEAAWNEKVSD